MYTQWNVQFSSVAQWSSTLQPHESQHARPPCPSPTPGVHSDSHPSSWWYHPAISSSFIPFSSCPPQSLPASESFPTCQVFSWGGQCTRVSPLASFLPKNIQGWSPLEWTSWISLQSKGFSRVFSNTTVQKHQFFGTLYSPTLISILEYWKNHSFDYTDLCWQSNVSASYMLSRLVIVFLQRSMHLLISWLQSPSAVILEPPQIKSDTVSIVSPFICHEVMGPDAMILVYWILSFKATFSLSSFTFIKRLFSSSSLSAIRVVSSD